MEDKYYSELVLIRMERAAELLKDATELLANDSYKSANNRAYYAIEKAIKCIVNETVINPPAELGRLTDAGGGEQSIKIENSAV